MPASAFACRERPPVPSDDAYDDEFVAYAALLLSAHEDCSTRLKAAGEAVRRANAAAEGKAAPE